MATVIDTNVLITLWQADDPLGIAAQRALDAAQAAGSLVCPAPVYAELMASPVRTEASIDAFFGDSGIRIDWHLSEAVWRAAGAAYQGYAKRRRQTTGGESRRILADFLIGAYASHHRARLLTLDQKTYRAAFPNLTIIKL